ncbi:MAG TPA: type II secretion system F family protein [Aestuariivirga sp.]
MIDYVQSFLQVQTIIVVLASLAVFATIVTIVSPMFADDKLAARTKYVTSERDRLKSAQRAALEAKADVTKLRERQSTGIFDKVVRTFNLRRVFEAEGTREILRRAGYRSERHLTMFLAMRAIMPIVVATLVFVYASTTFASHFTTSTRMLATLGGLFLGSFMPGFFVKNASSKRQGLIKNAWSDALDLMLICIESGMSLEMAMARVSREIGTQSVPLAEELQLTTAELSYLPDRRKALENLAKRTGLETVRSVVTAMIQAEKYGTPLGSALRVLAEENRKDRLTEAERKAAALPPKLTVPMIMFFLPVTFVVVLGPSLILVFNSK